MKENDSCEEGGWAHFVGAYGLTATKEAHSALVAQPRFQVAGVAPSVVGQARSLVLYYFGRRVQFRSCQV